MTDKWSINMRWYLFFLLLLLLTLVCPAKPILDAIFGEYLDDRDEGKNGGIEECRGLGGMTDSIIKK